MRWLELHRRLERNTGLLIFGILVVSSIGGMVQLLPIATQHAHAAPGLKPYSALELEGRDIYIRESCSTCHTQQIRPLLAEVKRYGPYSRAEEFAYDRPFLWGSKRTGPDLARIGGKYSDTWQKLHLIDPRSVEPRSIMPAYARLADEPADSSGSIQARMRALATLGHPYSAKEIDEAPAALAGRTELDALIAYLQSLGRASAGAAMP
ncbi:MAG TPA: cytochrome-c oxidase, cbb3-type subunit II [Steroidobacteraceae bacterium]|nr:cytochrome-c oxidase, cbb3-type subunit II [Steroidobacteraceae bacterium]